MTYISLTQSLSVYTPPAKFGSKQVKCEGDKVAFLGTGRYQKIFLCYNKAKGWRVEKFGLIKRIIRYVFACFNVYRDSRLDSVLRGLEKERAGCKDPIKEGYQGVLERFDQIISKSRSYRLLSNAYTQEVYGSRITILKEDLFAQKVDVLVNSANPALMGGGGIDDAFHRLAGNEELQKACLDIKPYENYEPDEAINEKIKKITDAVKKEANKTDSSSGKKKQTDTEKLKEVMQAKWKLKEKYEFVKNREVARREKRCRPGDAYKTSSCQLNQKGVKFIVHTVGPDCRDGEQNTYREKILTGAYQNSLNCLGEEKSIAFPGISNDIFKYPEIEAAKVAFQAVLAWCEANPARGLDIRLCYWTPNNQLVSNNKFQRAMNGARQGGFKGVPQYAPMNQPEATSKAASI